MTITSPESLQTSLEPVVAAPSFLKDVEDERCGEFESDMMLAQEMLRKSGALVLGEQRVDAFEDEEEDDDE